MHWRRRKTADALADSRKILEKYVLNFLNTTSRTIGVAGVLFTVVVLVGLGATLFREQPGYPELLQGVLVTHPEKLHGINLIDHNGTKVDVERFKSKWSFLFFGFTNCPDVCPATLAQFRLIKSRIRKQFDESTEVQFILVSVDPERDSVSHLSAYMNYFDVDFIGLTGKAEQIAALEKQLGAFHRFEKKSSSGNYNVVHSADVFLIDPHAEVAAVFQPPMNIGQVSEQFSLIVKRYEQSTRQI